MKKTLSAKILLFGAVVLMAAGCNSTSTTYTPPSNNTPTPTPAMSPTPTATPTAMPSPSPTSMGAEKTFTVTGQNYSFSPSSITVNKGDKVKITFQNSGGFHDFVIDEFNVKTASIGSGQSASVEFTADKTGTFQYYCSVSNHRAMGMFGTLTVK